MKWLEKEEKVIQNRKSARSHKQTHRERKESHSVSYFSSFSPPHQTAHLPFKSSDLHTVHLSALPRRVWSWYRGCVWLAVGQDSMREAQKKKLSEDSEGWRGCLPTSGRAPLYVLAAAAPAPEWLGPTRPGGGFATVPRLWCLSSGPGNL